MSFTAEGKAELWQSCMRKPDDTLSPRTLDFTVLPSRTADTDEMSQKIAKLEERIKGLQTALEIKDSAIEKMKLMNEKLKVDLKNKESMRMSQIELLALRNLELENEIHYLRQGNVPTCI
jgi:predicted RNase H-like nuclease (RuvC/YqgF family)